MFVLETSTEAEHNWFLHKTFKTLIILINMLKWNLPDSIYKRYCVAVCTYIVQRQFIGTQTGYFPNGCLTVIFKLIINIEVPSLKTINILHCVYIGCDCVVSLYIQCCYKYISNELDKI